MFDLTRAIDYFSTDSRQNLENLYRNKSTLSLKQGQFIAMEAKKIYIVDLGLVQLNKLHSSGDERILGLAYPSMPFGVPLTQVDSYEAIALSDVQLMQLDEKEIEESAQLAQMLLRSVTRRLQQTEELLAIVGERRVEDRLRSLLKFLGQEIGEETEQGIRLGVRLTHQQISDMIVTTRVSVTRLLMEFRKAGILEVDETRHLLIVRTTDN
jgi:CRP-like cAMP-binding protein